MKPIIYLRLLFIAMLTLFSSTAFCADINILSYGAKADGKTINTKAIQLAIDRCSKTGGTVIIPAGNFISGTLYLKSGVNIYLTQGAVLMGSPAFKDYPNNVIHYQSSFTNNVNGDSRTNKAFLFAEGKVNIKISGEGTINGNGLSPAFQLGDDSKSAESKTRPVMILMVDCKNITLENVNLKNSAYWMENYLGCSNLHFKGIYVFNHATYNNDAIDMDSKDVLIEDCTFDSDDDGICLKSHDRNKPCENITVRNCTVRSNCNAIKFGPASLGGFRNINISNVTIRQASESLIWNWQKSLKFIEQPITVLAGIAIENVDGGVTDNVTISNVYMEDVQTAIFIKLGNRGSKGPGETVSPNPGHMRNVTLNNITATGHSKITSSITGFPGYDVENVQLSNIRISDMGNGTVEEANKPVPESEKNYPENRMFGNTLPASGLYIRHVKGISFQNVNLEVRNADSRPVIIMDDVKNGLITELTTAEPIINNPTLELTDSKNILLLNPQIKSDNIPYLTVSGDQTQNINVIGLGDRKKAVVAGERINGQVHIN